LSELSVIVVLSYALQSAAPTSAPGGTFRPAILAVATMGRGIGNKRT
jgi:hypothetical protein